MAAAILNGIKDLIKYRYLIWSLALKDVKVRYRNPALGFLWTILIPLITVFILKFVFSVIMKTDVIEDYPFFIYLMTAVFPWSFFSSSISAATHSIFSNSELIKKTYFPRHILPVSAVLANLINFIPVLLVMILILIIFKMEFTIFVILMPLVLLVQTILTIGLALIVSSLQVVLQDIKYIVELLLMAWFYFSPAFYSLNMVAGLTDRFFKLYMLNPFVGLFCFYRVAFLKGFSSTLPSQVNIYALAAWTISASIVIFLSGFLVFKKYETRFSDLI